jgi:hypothetical protein
LDYNNGNRCLLCDPCQDVMSRTVWSNEFSCGMLISGQQCDHRSRRISTVKIHYQETTSESRLRTLSV